MAAGEKKLTAKQRRFVQAYARLLNGTRAAIEAGYPPRGARVAACRMLTNANIRAEIDELIEMPPDEVKARMSDIARGDIADLIEIDAADNIRFRLSENGQPNPKTKLIRKITRRTTRTVSPRGGETETTAVEIELYPADAALVKLGEYHGLWRQRVSHENPDGSPVEQSKIINIYIPHNGRERTTGN